jgi:uncharacterized damage-inducible protein DinB
MPEAAHLADALRGLYANANNGWFMPIDVTIEGLSSQQAATVPAERFNSVWAVVNHVRFWQDFARLRLQGQEVDRVALGAENGWPPIVDASSEEQWKAARLAAQAATEELAAFVATLSDQQLDEPYAPGRSLRSQLIHGVIGHNSYHACEIISIRHMLGLWLEDT